MAYYLNRERMRVVERNDRGNVSYRKKYVFGDEVDTSKIDDAQVESLVNSGALVEDRDNLKRRREGNVPFPGSQVAGAATAPSADHSEHFDVEDEDDGETDPSTAQTPGEDALQPEEVDDYTSMDYAELQQEAKSRDLNAGGSANDLRARLRADDDA